MIHEVAVLLPVRLVDVSLVEPTDKPGPAESSALPPPEPVPHEAARAATAARALPRPRDDRAASPAKAALATLEAKAELATLETQVLARLPHDQEAEPLKTGRVAAEPPALARLKEESDAVERAVAGLVELAAELQAQQRQRLAEMQQAAVELAVAIASRLVHERLESGNFAVENLVKKVIGRLETKQAVTVYLCPDDIALLESRQGQALFAGDANIRLIADDTLRRGDCRAESGDVGICARLEEELAELRLLLHGSLADAELERRKAAPANSGFRLFPDRRGPA